MVQPNMAAEAKGPFSIHNIPFGVISTSDDATPRCATAIGDYAVDLVKYARLADLKNVQIDVAVFASPTLNAFAALPRGTRSEFRRRIQEDLKQGSIKDECFVLRKDVKMHLPMTGEYSDFYCSLEHCKNCSPMSANKIPKNWFYAPSVYNARASSLVASTQPIRRPKGVFFLPGPEKEATYGPSQALDFELEMGYFVSNPVPYGQVLDIDNVKDHIFGFVLLNDWSARDLQLFEMTPLGPFHGKGFGTSISPWVVTLEAMESFSCPPKTKQDPPPFEHLRWKDNANGALDVKLSVELIRDGQSYKLATSNLKYLYWTPYQQLTHHAAAMCGMRTGDICGTGTISGDKVDSKGNKLELGCLYEATEGGSKVVTLEDGTTLKYLEDGDEIVLSGWCGDEDSANASVGFGECRGVILPA